MELQTSTIITSEYGGDNIFHNRAYGYVVYDNHPLAVVKDFELFLGLSIKVEGYDYISFEGKIPSSYVIREKNTQSFVCGLDLTKNGCIVECMDSKRFISVETCLAYVKWRTSKDLYICVEGEMCV